MKTRIFALLLALVMAVGLAACSAPAAESTQTPAPSVQPSQAVEIDLTQDILAYSAGLSADDTIATINGTVVPADFFLYFLAINCSYYGRYGYTPELYGEFIRSESLNLALCYTLLKEKGLEYGCPLTDEQQAEIQTALANADEFKALYGLSDESLWDVQALSMYYDNLLNAIIPTPTDEELNNYVYQAKHILITTAKEGTDGTVTLSTGGAATNEDGTPFTGTVEEYNAAALAKAEDILAQIRASEDPAATFDALMHEHSEDGRDAEGNLGAPDGFTTTLGKMVSEFEEAALALNFGEISSLVKSTYGYHIILRGQVENLSSYAQDLREKQLDAQLNTWIQEADIVEGEALYQINVPDFFSRFVAYQTAWSEQYAKG